MILPEEILAIGIRVGLYTMPFAMNVVKIARCLSSRAATGRYIAVIVLRKKAERIVAGQVGEPFVADLHKTI